MSFTVTETFFLPEEVERIDWRAPAKIYNLSHSLLARSETSHVFVPIRSMQFMAVLDKKEIVFVDSQSYAYSQEQGGRIILIAWQFHASQDRESLFDSMPCQVVFYERKDRELQRRLVAQFREAMEMLDKRYRNTQIPAKGAKILKL